VRGPLRPGMLPVRRLRPCRVLLALAAVVAVVRVQVFAQAALPARWPPTLLPLLPWPIATARVAPALRGLGPALRATVAAADPAVLAVPGAARRASPSAHGLAGQARRLAAVVLLQQLGRRRVRRCPARSWARSAQQCPRALSASPCPAMPVRRSLR